MVLLHAPSVYDFRERAIIPGPISEVVPSLYVFDMYPYGFLTLWTWLSRAGYRVGVFNLAAKMLLDGGFDVEGFLRRLEARVYGIDLHWMVHAHGALEVARIVKEHHPDSVVVLGGLSSSYYWGEILGGHPEVDAVVRGDSAEVPVELLLGASERGEFDPSGIPNLAWRDRDGRIRANPVSWVPESLDEFGVDHGLLVRQALRSRDLGSTVPYAAFLEAPIAAVLTVKGCPFACAACGGSRGCYERVAGRRGLALKSPRAIAEEVESVASRMRAPIFLIGDLRLGGGERRVEEVAREIRSLGLDNDLIFEFFTPAGRSTLEKIRGTAESVYLQISPESPFETVRRAFGRPYGNGELERMVRAAVEMGFRRTDLYFMTGLPGQTPEMAAAVADYFGRLLESTGAGRGGRGGLDAFTAPLAPFLDPGSEAFERPDLHGYRVLFRGLEDHRRALLAPHWKYTLNYETDAMDRDLISRASSEAAERLLRLKGEAGVSPPGVVDAGLRRIEFCRRAEALIDSFVRSGGDAGEALSRMKGRLEELAGEMEVRMYEELYPKYGLVDALRLPRPVRALIRSLLPAR